MRPSARVHCSGRLSCCSQRETEGREKTREQREGRTGRRKKKTGKTGKTRGRTGRTGRTPRAALFRANKAQPMANASASMLVWTRDTGMNASCASAPARGGRPCETVSGPADARWLALFGLLLPLFVFFVFCLVFGVCLACVRLEKDVETMIQTWQFHIVIKI